MKIIRYEVSKGELYNDWSVISESFKHNGRLFTNCKCACGNTRKVNVKNLVKGLTKNCGCIRRLKVGQINLSHGQTVNGKQTKEYRAWAGMMKRCYNNKAVGYQSYGGRGIIVDERWHDFKNFYADMGIASNASLTLDRIDVNGHYNKNNCRWASREVQSNNTRSNRFIDHNGERLTLAQWSRKIKIEQSVLANRLKKWGVKRAIETPLMLIAFFVASIISINVSAQTIQGYDTLALAQYCNQYLNAPKLPAVSTLMNTFGDPLPCIEKRIKQGGVELVQIDLIDATCWRGGRCPAGVPRPDDLNVILARARQVNKFAIKYPRVEWWLSPALEHDVRDEKKVIAMLQTAKKGCPTCKIINSPFTGARPAGFPVELHGTTVSAFAVSGDGASMFDADNIKSDNNKFQHRISGRYKTFAWFPELNLRCTGEKDFTPPLKRTNKPSADLFTQAFMVMKKEEPKPTPPAICRSTRDITNSEYNKPNAEAYCNGQRPDPRGNKNLLILSLNKSYGDKLPIYNAQNKKVGDFCYYGTFENGLHRWYTGSCGGGTPIDLHKKLGGEWGFVMYGKNNCIRFNAIRRQGIYR